MPSSTQIRLASRPHGEPQDSDFETVETDLPALEDGQVLLRTIYVSLDPYVRGRMSDAESYADPMQVGDVVVGGTVCQVEESRSDRRSVGDVVLAYTGWQTHAVVDARATRRLDPGAAPLSTALGVLGMPGFTAYAGLLDIGRPQAGETLVVAAAAGPVGSAVGQIARIKGLRAVGIAGGPEKARLLTEELGFDIGLDHRADDFAQQLADAVPSGIDVYFENVGGAVADAVYPLLNDFARVPICGMVSTYNATGTPDGPDRLSSFYRRLLTKRLTVQGFLQDQYTEQYWSDFQRDMTAWIEDGSVRYLEDVADGLDSAPAAFRGMLTGANVGKQLVRVGDDPTS